MSALVAELHGPARRVLGWLRLWQALSARHVCHSSLTVGRSASLSADSTTGA